MGQCLGTEHASDQVKPYNPEYYYYYYSSKQNQSSQKLDSDDAKIICFGGSELMTVSGKNTIKSRCNMSWTLPNDTDTISAISNGWSNRKVMLATNDRKIYGYGHADWDRKMDQKDVLKFNTFTEIPVLTTFFAKVTIKQIEMGHGHIMFLSAGGDVWGLGENKGGNCGMSIVENEYITGSPKLIDDFKGINIVQIGCGGGNTVCLSDKGELFTFGGWGGLLLKKYKNSFPTEKYDGQVVRYPFFHANNIKIQRISVGGHHIVVLDTNNFCWSFGWNKWKECGPKNDTEYKFPERVSDFCAGGLHSVFLTLDCNNIYTMGKNDKNECSMIHSDIDMFDRPHYVDKEEIGIKPYEVIQRVIAYSDETIIVVGITMPPSKKEY